MRDVETRVSIRPAEPTREDGMVFARLLDYAQEGLFRIKLGRVAVDVVARAYLQPGHDLSYEYVSFAERSGQIVGAASGYTGEEHRHHTHRPIQEAAGLRRLRMAPIVFFSGMTLRFMDRVPDGDFYVRCLAVDPGCRSEGIGTKLLALLEEKARSEGSQRFTLDVAKKNKRGQALYERLGFTVAAESPRFLGIHNTNVARMVKPL